ncbi:MAG: peptidoglycan bridge formation glycyltransferase FemA/FemB family protein [Gemmatimonadetes bacterium]|nr:peptidoglycan bridge formation glycyltransferase FemA/FemB family protein [Gemmatimonadota bacterium]
MPGSEKRLVLNHTTGWAQRMQDFLGYDARFVTVYGESGQPTLRLVLSIGWPFQVRGLGESARILLPALTRARIGAMKWFGEPVCVSEADDSDHRALVEALRRYSNRRRLKVSSGSWPVIYEHLLPPSWNATRGATLLVDLTKSVDELLAGCKSSARKAIRRAERDGVRVRQVESIDELRAYYGFAEECSRRYRKRMHGVGDFESMWYHLRPQGYFETFVAEHDGEPIAGLSAWGFGSTIGELGSFQSERSFRDKLFGPDLAKWKLIEWGHQQGIRHLDLSGISPEPANDKDASIRQFKEKWGGKYYEYTYIT